MLYPGTDTRSTIETAVSRYTVFRIRFILMRIRIRIRIRGSASVIMDPDPDSDADPDPDPDPTLLNVMQGYNL